LESGYSRLKGKKKRERCDAALLILDIKLISHIKIDKVEKLILLQTIKYKKEYKSRRMIK
jgi:hypothetical protein